MLHEQFQEKLGVVGKDEKSRSEYKKALEMVGDTIYYQHNPPASYWETSCDLTPEYIAKQLDPENPVTQAAMWTSAIAVRGRNNSVDTTITGGTSLTLSEIWKDTELEPLADKCEEGLDQLKPKTSNEIATIEIPEMKRLRVEKIRYASPKEWLVFLGINGAGKDFLIGYLTKFLDFCGMDNEVIKMPNPNGVFFETINKFLHGDEKVKLNPNAAQLLCLADAANTDVSDGKLTIMNRSPLFETMVFGLDELQPAVLASHPIFNAVTHTIIVDRLPAIALEAVNQRETDPRIFERKIETMLDLHSRYAALTYLPGVRLLNTDFYTKNEKEQLAYSFNRLFFYVKSFGILQRKMIRSKLAENYVQAGEILAKKFVQFKKTFGYCADS